MIRTLIADDEQLAREGIRMLLAHEADFELCGEAATGPEAVHSIKTRKPDLVFLDVQMPGLNGFEVLELAGDSHLPLVVFVTAYSNYAVQAFEKHAVDYLLKPIAPGRLRDTISRVRHKFADNDEIEPSHHSLKNALDAHADRARQLALATRGAAETYVKRFVVRDRNRFLLLRAESVQWIKAAANYLELHTQNGVHMIRATVTDLDSRLDPGQFARIHRSTIVNIDQVKEIMSECDGDCTVVLRDGTILPLGRGFRARILG